VILSKEKAIDSPPHSRDCHVLEELEPIQKDVDPSGRHPMQNVERHKAQSVRDIDISAIIRVAAVYSEESARARTQDRKIISTTHARASYKGKEKKEKKKKLKGNRILGVYRLLVGLLSLEFIVVQPTMNHAQTVAGDTFP